jgi:hypothetical protein
MKLTPAAKQTQAVGDGLSTQAVVLHKPPTAATLLQNAELLVGWKVNQEQTTQTQVAAAFCFPTAKKRKQQEQRLVARQRPR